MLQSVETATRQMLETGAKEQSGPLLAKAAPILEFMVLCSTVRRDVNRVFPAQMAAIVIGSSGLPPSFPSFLPSSPSWRATSRGTRTSPAARCIWR